MRRFARSTACIAVLAASVAAQGFTDVASQAGVGFSGFNTARMSWGDYDSDGDPDLFLPINGGSYQPNDILARNEGNGTFVDVAAQAGVQGSAALAFQLGSSWADFDRDGDLDLFVAASGGPQELFRNEGNGTFTDVAPAAGIAGFQIGARIGVWADVDGDGWVDLYVAARNDPPLLLRNNGDGTFTDVAAAAGVVSASETTDGASFGDYDADGDPDLYVASVASLSPSKQYRNDGGWSFTDVTAAAGLAALRNGDGGIWADLDGDGLLDLYFADLRDASGMVGRHYRNLGNGTFSEVGTSSGLRFWQHPEVVCRAASCADYDNDGDLDVYVTRTNTWGGTYPPWNLMFRNEGDGTFSDATTATLTGCTLWAEGSAWADYDLDGDSDLYVANDWPDACRLYRNDAAAGAHWVRLRLVGVASSPDAIGARVRLKAGGAWQLRAVSGGGGGMGCQDSLPVEIGLGASALIEEVWVEWPAGGVDAWIDLDVDREHVLVEGGGIPCQAPVRYCQSAPNSVGPGALIDSTGTPSFTRNDFHLTASGAPPGKPGIFFYGLARTQVPFWDGWRCVGPGGLVLFRIAPPLVVDPSGSADRWLDLSQPPLSSGPGQVGLGETWNFQLWYRDPQGPGGTGANLSDALSATFCP